MITTKEQPNGDWKFGTAAPPARLLCVEADQLPPVSTASDPPSMATNPPSMATDRFPPLLNLIPRPVGAWQVAA